MTEQIEFPTREQARRQREQEQRGFLMPLPRTGGWAQVRSLSLADSAAFAGLPTQAAGEVLRFFEDLRAEGGPGTLTMERLRRNQERQERLANLACCAGFVKPRLVLTAAELDDDPHTMLVTDLHLDERIRYLQLALGQDGEAAKSLRPVDGASLGAVDALPAFEAAPAPF